MTSMAVLRSKLAATQSGTVAIGIQYSGKLVKRSKPLASMASSAHSGEEPHLSPQESEPALPELP